MSPIAAVSEQTDQVCAVQSSEGEGDPCSSLQGVCQCTSEGWRAATRG